MEAAITARCGFRLDGDVITSNGSLLAAAQQAQQLQAAAASNGAPPTALTFDDDIASVCSCVSCTALSTCVALTGKRKPPRYTVRRAPGKITHLLPIIGCGGGGGGEGGEGGGDGVSNGVVVKGGAGHCGPQRSTGDEDVDDDNVNSFVLSQMLQQKRASV